MKCPGLGQPRNPEADSPPLASFCGGAGERAGGASPRPGARRHLGLPVPSPQTSCRTTLIRASRSGPLPVPAAGQVFPSGSCFRGSFPWSSWLAQGGRSLRLLKASVLQEWDMLPEGSCFPLGQHWTPGPWSSASVLWTHHGDRPAWAQSLPGASFPSPSPGTRCVLLSREPVPGPQTPRPGDSSGFNRWDRQVPQWRADVDCGSPPSAGGGFPGEGGPDGACVGCGLPGTREGRWAPRLRPPHPALPRGHWAGSDPAG